MFDKLDKNIYALLAIASPFVEVYLYCIFCSTSFVVASIVFGELGSSFGCCIRKFSGGSALGEKVLSHRAEDGAIRDQIARIREEFDFAKRSFLDVPKAIKMMPKMDPKGKVLLILVTFGAFLCVLSDSVSYFPTFTLLNVRIWLFVVCYGAWGLRGSPLCVCVCLRGVGRWNLFAYLCA